MNLLMKIALVALVVWGVMTWRDPYRTRLPLDVSNLSALQPQLDRLPEADKAYVLAYLGRSHGDVLPPAFADPDEPFTARTFAEAIALQKKFELVNARRNGSALVVAPLPSGYSPAEVAPPRMSPADAPTPTGVPVPDEEPSEEVLRKLEFARYAEIDRMGGLPVTVTATGRSYILRPKLYAVRKESCTPTPQSPPGWYECSLTITLSLAEDGRDPSDQGERIGVKWDPKGEWVTQ